MKDQEKTSKGKALIKEDEISLIDLAKTLWVSRGTIIKTIVVFTLLGLFVALFSEKEYEASTIMVPQINNPSSNLGGLSSLASLAGFNMDMNAESNVISPVLYPMIISSTSFQLEIMNTAYLFEEIEDSVSLIDYYLDFYRPGLWGTIKKYTIGLPGLIMSATQDEELTGDNDIKSETIVLSRDQEKVRKIIEKHLSLTVNSNDGYLVLTSRAHQAFLAAQLAQKSQSLLHEYITKFKVEKAAAQLEFIKERYEENKNEFEEAQAKLAAFRDANKNISSEILRTREEQLQNENQLAFDVYSELAKQLEQSLIKVEEQTPVFSVIKEVIVPFEKSKPKRSLILFVWFILGAIMGIGVAVWKKYSSLVKSRWESTDLNSANDSNH